MFDLVSHPDGIRPAYGFYAIFYLAGAILAGLTFAALKWRSKRLRFLAWFAPVWIGGVLVLSFLDARDALQIRKLVQKGEYETVEGCLTSFHPGSPYGSKTTAGNEWWEVAGQAFSYGEGEARPGYHLVEARGGLVHPDSRVRVSFVTSPYYGRKEIVRLHAIRGACPAAPDSATGQSGLGQERRFPGSEPVAALDP